MNPPSFRPRPKRPTWMTVIGILGIIFASFGILSGIQVMMLPTMLKYQDSVFSDFDAAYEDIESMRPPADFPLPDGPNPPEIPTMFKNIFGMPPWFPAACTILGIATLGIYGFYLFASISLLRTTPNAKRGFCIAAFLAILLGAAKGTTGLLAGSFMTTMILMGGFFSLVVHIVLLAVAINGRPPESAPQFAYPQQPGPPPNAPPPPPPQQPPPAPSA